MPSAYISQGFMVIIARKTLAFLALLLCAQGASASLIVNGGFENPDIEALPGNTPYLLKRNLGGGVTQNYALLLQDGQSIPGWTIDAPLYYGADLIHNNIGPAPTGGAYWPSAYEGEQYMYLNRGGSTTSSMYQDVFLTGDHQYALEFFLNGLTGYGSYFDGLPYQPQVLVSILDGSLNPVFQQLVTGTSNTSWTEIDLDFSILNSGSYRLMFSAPTNPTLPAGQDQNFITLDGISLLEAVQPPPPPEPDPEPQPVSVPPTLWCVLAGLIGTGVARRRVPQPNTL